MAIKKKAIKGGAKSQASSEVPRRLQIIFDHASQQAIDNLRAATGGSATAADVIRDALHFYDWVREQVQEKDCDIALAKDNELQAVVKLPFNFRKPTSISRQGA